MKKKKEEKARRAKEKVEREKQKKYEEELEEFRERVAQYDKKTMLQHLESQDIPMWKIVHDMQNELARLKGKVLILQYSKKEQDKAMLDKKSMEFIAILSKLCDFDAKIDSGDVDTAISIYQRHPELIDARSIKFLIVNGYRNDGTYGFKKVTDLLKKALVGTKYYDALVKYIQTVNDSKTLNKMKEAGRDKMTITSIAQQLGLNETDDSIEEIDDFNERD